MTYRDAALLLAATPLGNPADASPRLSEALRTAELVAAEDTRRVRRLAAELGIEISGRVLSYFEGNEESRTPMLLEALRVGQRVVLVSDAGMPSVSDPGYRLVAAAVGAGVRVSCLPGPSAVTTALAVSGLPSDRFCFEGFLPRRDAARRAALHELAGERRTIVLFESPHRVAGLLADAAAILGGDRRAAICRELTKTYEEVLRGTLAELAASVSQLRGEITVVLAGATVSPPDPQQLAAAVAGHVADGMTRRDAAARVAADTGAPRNAVYDASVRGGK